MRAANERRVILGRRRIKVIRRLLPRRQWPRTWLEVYLTVPRWLSL